MGYYGITFGMVNLSDDLFSNYIVSSLLGGSFFNPTWETCDTWDMWSEKPTEKRSNRMWQEQVLTEFCRLNLFFDQQNDRKQYDQGVGVWFFSSSAIAFLNQPDNCLQRSHLTFWFFWWWTSSGENPSSRAASSSLASPASSADFSRRWALNFPFLKSNTISGFSFS